MSYLVLARKYRPQRFLDLVGQEHVSRTLHNAIAQGRVHHAFLFTGARGVGKTSAARILAKALSCAEGPTATPCGTCDACTEIASGQSVDVFEIDGASNTGVDDVRALREGIRYLPAKGKKKIYIIDEVHMLSTSAFNALLKTLEEPPAHVVFVFATTEVHKIPTTILSRCQRYDFKLIPTTRLVEHLTQILEKEGIGVEGDALRLIARQGAGSVRDCLSLLDQVIAYVGTDRITRDKVAEILGVADRRMLVELAGAVLARDAAAALRLVARAVDRGLDLGQMAKAFLGFLRDLEVVRTVKEPADIVDVTPDELEEARALVTSVDVGLLPILFDRWARAVDEAARVTTPRLLYEMALVDLTVAEPLVPLGDLLDRLEELEGRLVGAGPGQAGGGGARGAAAPRAGVVPAAARPAADGSRLADGAGARAPGAGTAAGRPGGDAEGQDQGGVAERGGRSGRPEGMGGRPGPQGGRESAGAGTEAAPADAGEAWRRVLRALETQRPRVAALMAHAAVGEVEPGRVTLLFQDRYSLDSAEKVRGEVEQTLSAELGQPTRVTFAVGITGQAEVARSEVAVERDAEAEDKRRRKDEALAHPALKKIKDRFAGAAVREVKT